jgi:transposase
VHDAVAGDPLTCELMDAMLAALWKEYGRLHDLVDKFAGREFCRRFMRIPGVGPVTALSFMRAI